MNWEEASILIKNTIRTGYNINTQKSTFRYVDQVPPFQCKRYDYKNEAGYKVRIGVRDFVEIPITMLETVFNLATENNRIYNNKVFADAFPKQARDHGCHVHVVGRIFELSGVANKKGGNYEIL
jgi:hypothetical protein